MRTEFSLDSDWFFQYETENRKRSSHSAAYNAAKAGGEQGAGSPGFEDGDWQGVNLPHDFGSFGAFRKDCSVSDGYRVKKNAWYRRSFCIHIHSQRN